ncbi:hypothetical protein DVH24_028706 [Malus domestica]|uniref:Uncharacterized protein n=1 Tax=Malus domestica TaxID=3750 RepID=A0A498IVC7_MALDO|nr:hypothetical protein DVH24_028706 [Malus domestica]
MSINVITHPNYDEQLNLYEILPSLKFGVQNEIFGVLRLHQVLDKKALNEIKRAPRTKLIEVAAHMVASYAVRMGGSHSWDGLEPEWLFNTLASGVNISIRI